MKNYFKKDGVAFSFSFLGGWGVGGGELASKQMEKLISMA